MSATFLQTLKTEVARMHAAHPERVGDITRANALILQGMVLPSVDDPTTAHVLSSDGTTHYTVNGRCNCQAGQHGKPCKHMHAWKLYQYIAARVQQRLAAAPTPVDPEVMPEPWPDNDPEDLPPVEVTTPVVTPLPEAPASVNCHITLEGRQVQLTLRGTDETRLLQRLAAVLKQYPLPAQPATQDRPQGQGQGWCSKHNVQMKLNHGQDGRSWYSHRTDEGRWCKGR